MKVMNLNAPIKIIEEDLYEYGVIIDCRKQLSINGI